MMSSCSTVATFVTISKRTPTMFQHLPYHIMDYILEFTIVPPYILYKWLSLDTLPYQSRVDFWNGIKCNDAAKQIIASNPSTAPALFPLNMYDGYTGISPDELCTTSSSTFHFEDITSLDMLHALSVTEWNTIILHKSSLAIKYVEHGIFTLNSYSALSSVWTYQPRMNHLIRRLEEIDPYLINHWINLNTSTIAIEILKKYPALINWNKLSYNSHSNAIQLLKDNPHKINYETLCNNPNKNIIQILKENYSKINWYQFGINQLPFEIDTIPFQKRKIRYRFSLLCPAPAPPAPLEKKKRTINPVHLTLHRCECGKEYKQMYRGRHLKTNFHLNYMNNN